jgi:hypothetical protein
MAGTITKETEQEGKGKAKKRTAHMNKKGRELIPLMVRRYMKNTRKTMHMIITYKPTKMSINFIQY